jgi:hypothetical protein
MTDKEAHLHADYDQPDADESRNLRNEDREKISVDEQRRADTERAYDLAMDRAQETEDLKSIRGRIGKESGGRSFASVVKSYVGLEDTLKRDPAAGLVVIGQNMGLNPAQLRQMLEPYASQQDGGAGYARQTLHTTDAEALIHHARATVSDFAGLEPQIIAALNSGAIVRTGNMAADLEQAYRYARDRQYHQSQVERAKKAARIHDDAGSDDDDDWDDEDQTPAERHSQRQRSADQERLADVEKAYDRWRV